MFTRFRPPGGGLIYDSSTFIIITDVEHIVNALLKTCSNFTKKKFKIWQFSILIDRKFSSVFHH